MKLAILPAFSRSGGGSFQWTGNILHALSDYAGARPNVSVEVYYLPAFRDVDEVRSTFPRLRFHPIGRVRARLAAIAAKIAFAAPRLIPHLRSISPLDRLFRSSGVDWILFPVTLIHSSMCRTPHTFFLADIAHVFYPHFPEVSAGGELRRRHIIFEHGLAAASHVVVESEELRRQISEHYGADPTKVDVLHQAVPRSLDEAASASAAYEAAGIEGAYLFYPAQLWPHKNHATLLRALALLRASQPDLQLVLTGGRQPGSDAIFELAEELGIEDAVRYLGYVPDHEMAALYRNATALVMPTYFGPTNIPTLEAFQFGCPAVISDLPGVREQVGDAALLFDPDSPDDLARQIARLWSEPELASVLRRRGTDRLQRFSYVAYRERFFEMLDRRVLAPMNRERSGGTAR